MVTEQFRDGSLTIPGAARRGNLPEYSVRYAIEQGHLRAEPRAGRVLVAGREPGAVPGDAAMTTPRTIDQLLRAHADRMAEARKQFALFMKSARLDQITADEHRTYTQETP